MDKSFHAEYALPGPKSWLPKSLTELPHTSKGMRVKLPISATAVGERRAAANEVHTVMMEELTACIDSSMYDWWSDGGGRCGISLISIITYRKNRNEIRTNPTGPSGGLHMSYPLNRAISHTIPIQMCALCGGPTELQC